MKAGRCLCRAHFIRGQVASSLFFTAVGPLLWYAEADGADCVGVGVGGGGNQPCISLHRSVSEFFAELVRLGASNQMPGLSVRKPHTCSGVVSAWYAGGRRITTKKVMTYTTDTNKYLSFFFLMQCSLFFSCKLENICVCFIPYF